jgi:hypothetical protein
LQLVQEPELLLGEGEGDVVWPGAGQNPRWEGDAILPQQSFQQLAPLGAQMSNLARDMVHDHCSSKWTVCPIMAMATSPGAQTKRRGGAGR